jgi:hypothetical protein
MRYYAFFKHVARMRERGGAFRAVVGESEGKRPLGRPSLRCEDNIKMDLERNTMGERGLDLSGSR